MNALKIAAIGEMFVPTRKLVAIALEADGSVRKEFATLSGSALRHAAAAVLDKDGWTVDDIIQRAS